MISYSSGISLIKGPSRPLGKPFRYSYNYYAAALSFVRWGYDEVGEGGAERW